MNNQAPKLNLKECGLVYAEILWNEGKLFKIKFKHDINDIQYKTEIFHYTEILNFNEIFIRKDLKIVPYDATLDGKNS